MIKQCSVCLKPMIVPDSQAHRYTTCSKLCRSTHRKHTTHKPKREFNCTFCGKLCQTYPSRDKQHLCSTSCPGPAVPKWSERFAYLLGLLASDGNLQSRGSKRISFSNTEPTLVKFVAENLPRATTLTKPRIQEVTCVWPRLYDFMVAIGIQPRKSLTMGALKIPDMWFAHFYRGYHDGNGTTSRSKGHLYISLSCFAPEFRAWVASTSLRLFDVCWGRVNTPQMGLHCKKAQQFAVFIWPDNCFCLERKRPK
jgi:hypothetical protein